MEYFALPLGDTVEEVLTNLAKHKTIEEFLPAYQVRRADSIVIRDFIIVAIAVI